MPTTTAVRRIVFDVLDEDEQHVLRRLVTKIYSQVLPAPC
jgi:hypothetical protein